MDFKKELTSTRAKVAIAVTVVIFLVLIATSRSIESKLLGGIWRTNEEFNARAGLYEFVLTLDPSLSDSGGLGAYFLAYNENGKILSNPAVFNFGPHICLTPWVKKQEYRVKIDFLGEDTFIKEEQKLTFYPIEGKLIMSHVDSDGEEVETAVLYRDSASTFKISEQ
jgi:hypothetical protein